MQEYPAARACGRCTAPAMFRLALVSPAEKPAVILARRAHYRCAQCFLDGLNPAVLAVAPQGQLVVVDPAYTATALELLGGVAS